MAYTITYTAKRSISGGRSYGTSYAFDVPLVRADRTATRQISTAVSLSGRRFTNFHRLDIGFTAQTAPIDTATVIDQMVEFLDSCAGGEIFDIAGTNYVLDGDYSQSLVDISGFYSFTFSVVGAD